MAKAGQESDARLMARVQRGDRQAFAALVRRHTDRFYAAAFRMCGQAEEAEDIVQDAFLKLWDRPDLYDESRGAQFTTWFYRVVTNQALDHLRKRKPHYDSEALERFGDNAPGAESALQARQEQKAVEAAIQSLPARQKAALNLCFYEGLSNAAAAAVLGVGVKALESLLMRAKAGVRDRLARQGFLGEEKKYG